MGDDGASFLTFLARRNLEAACTQRIESLSLVRHHRLADEHVNHWVLRSPFSCGIVDGPATQGTKAVYGRVDCADVSSAQLRVEVIEQFILSTESVLGQHMRSKRDSRRRLRLQT